MQIFDKKTIEYLMKLFRSEIYTPDGNLDVEHEGSDPSHVRVKNDVGQLDLLVDEIGDRGLYDTTEYETGWLIKTDGLDTYLNRGDVKAANSIEAGVHISAVGDITAGRDASVGQDLTVTRDITAGRNITATGSVGADQDVAAGRNVSATGSVSAGLDVAATRNVTAGGDITATGDVSGDNISADTSITSGGTITATGNVTAGGDITAIGNIESDGNISADGTITAAGNVTGAGFVVPNGTSSQYLKADGSVDDSITADRLPYSIVSVAGNNGWVEVARYDIVKAASEASVFTAIHNAGLSFIISSYRLKSNGIVNLSYRKDANATSPKTSFTYLSLVCRDKSLTAGLFKLVIRYNYPSTGTTRVSLYYDSPEWSPVRFTKIDEGAFQTKTTNWVMLNTTDSYQTGGSLPTESSTCIWISCTDDSYAATAGAVASPSDERLKAIREEIKLNIEDIASAPSILFNWKDKQDDSIHGGTIAQYWQEIAPWAVSNNNEGMLSINYPTLALAASIQCAREVVDLRKEVTELKEQIAELRKLVNG